MVLDRRSLSYAAIGLSLSPSWMLLDLEVRPAAADSNVSSMRGPEESLCTSRDRAGGGGVTFAARRTKFSLPGFGHVSEVA